MKFRSQIKPSDDMERSISKSLSWVAPFSFRSQRDLESSPENYDIGISSNLPSKEENENTKERILKWIEQSSIHSIDKEILGKQTKAKNRSKDLKKKPRKKSWDRSTDFRDHIEKTNAQPSSLFQDSTNERREAREESESIDCKDADDLCLEAFEQALRVIAQQSKGLRCPKTEYLSAD